jgi:serine/threonine protein kinase/predicted Zn-dependent protease
MTTEAAWAEIDPYIEAFERARAIDPDADPAAFLPPADHPHSLTILIELLRVDLEFSCDSGRPTTLEECLERFPELRGNPEAITPIAFEDFRLRRARGESVDPNDYHKRYGIDVRSWPLQERESETHAPRSTTSPEDLPPLPEKLVNEFPGFRLLRLLGRGTFGCAYLASQGELANRPVVLKIAFDLRGEPEILARLQHTNIVPIHSVHRSGGIHAFCMPFFGATTAAHLLEELRGEGKPFPKSGRWITELLSARHEGEALPERELLDRLESLSYTEAILMLVSRIADGLAYAHARGVLHKDLKPANVLLSEDGEPMLLDFNLARSAAAAGGTLAYMSPERLEAFLSNKPYSDPRDDIYALGLILYELLGGPPVSRNLRGTPDEVAGLLAAHRRTVPLDLRSQNDQVTPAISAIVARCLAPSPEHRYDSASQLREDIVRHLANLPLRFAPERSPRELFRKWRRRHPRLASAYGIATVAVCMLVLLGTSFVLMKRELHRSETENNLQKFRGDLFCSELLLSSPDPNKHDIEEGLRLAEQARRRFGDGRESSDPEELIRLLPLDGDNRGRLRSEYAELYILTARGEHLLALHTADLAVRGQRLEAALRWNGLAERCSTTPETSQAIKLQRAWLFALMGRQHETRKLADEAAAMGHGTASRSLRAYASQLMHKGRFREAVELLRRANRQDPANPMGWFLLGSCHEHLGQFDRAIGCYDVVIALHPESHLGYYRRAAVLAQAKRHEDAIPDYDQALLLHPDYWPAYIDRALSRGALGQTTGAIADLDAALTFADAPTRIYFLRSEWKSKNGDKEGAEVDRRQGLTRTPNDELSYIARGYARLPGNPAGAMADFDAALAINPTSAPALANKAAVLTDQGRAKEALALLDIAVDAHPDFVLARSGRAVLRARLGQRRGAQEDARAATQLSSEGLVLYQAACVYALTAHTHSTDQAEAFRLLTAALAAGFGKEHIASDPDLDNIRKDPRFAAILTEFRITTRQ